MSKCVKLKRLHRFAVNGFTDVIAVKVSASTNSRLTESVAASNAPPPQ